MNMVPRILVGSHSSSQQAVYERMQNFICGKQDNCIRCQQIIDKSYYGLVWLTPAKNYYTLQELDRLFHALSFAHDMSEKWCIVIEQAERLSILCANSLLKVLEEPSPQTAIFLLCTTVQELLPTIKSRCIIENISGATSFDNKLLDSLKQASHRSIHQFGELLQEHMPPEHSAAQLLDELVRFYHEQAQIGDSGAYALIDFLLTQYKKLPMPGSSKIFWRNIFLQISRINHP